MAMHVINSLSPWLWGILIVWSIAWKGIGLWYSARYGQIYWFLVMFILNTAGILEIIYCLFFRPRGEAGLYPKPRHAAPPGPAREPGAGGPE
jgi:methionyl-tRNA synthetase